MWQRRQTVFLLLAVIAGIVTLSLQFHSWVLHVVLLLAMLLNVYTVFIYKRRPVQARCCMFSIFVYVAWYIALIVYSKQVAPDASQFQLVWTDAMPAVAAILTLMARQAIIADEKLVRAADRLR